MRSKVRILGAPLHPLLIVFPVGLWVTSLVADLVFLATRAGFWALFATWMMIFGWVGAALATLPGLTDYLKVVPKSGPAHRMATRHGLLNVLLVLLYGLNIGLRATDGVGGLEVALNAVSVLILGYSGWLGGHVAHVHRVSVEEPAEIRDIREEERRAA